VRWQQKNLVHDDCFLFCFYAGFLITIAMPTDFGAVI
jgi:hypothetical protein